MKRTMLAAGAGMPASSRAHTYAKEGCGGRAGVCAVGVCSVIRSCMRQCMLGRPGRPRKNASRCFSPSSLPRSVVCMHILCSCFLCIRK